MKFLINIFTNWLVKEKEPPKLPMCDFKRICYEVRPCDVLLIEGRSRVSEVIKLITQSSWSHSALYIGRLHNIEDPEIRKLAEARFSGSPDTPLIIEGMLGQGTIISPLSSYEKDHIRLCRPRGLSPKDAQRIINHAVSKLGYEYDIRHIFDLARFLLPWTIMPRRLRSRLFCQQPGTETRTVCSSMIAEAFNYVEFPILPYIHEHAEKGFELIHRNPKLYTPSDFDYSPYFEIIKYPFLGFEDHAMYRNLPWNRQGFLSDDKNIYQEVDSSEQESQLKQELAEQEKIKSIEEKSQGNNQKFSLFKSNKPDTSS